MPPRKRQGLDYRVKSMDSTAQSMEGLTKAYHAELLISETLYDALAGAQGNGEAAALSFRLLDSVAVMGKTKGVKIYTAKASLSPEEARAWALHNQGMELYYQRDFAGAAGRFGEALALLPGDFSAAQLLERCKNYAVSPPPPSWNGVEVMRSK